MLKILQVFDRVYSDGFTTSGEVIVPSAPLTSPNLRHRESWKFTTKGKNLHALRFRRLDGQHLIEEEGGQSTIIPGQTTFLFDVSFSGKADILSELIPETDTNLTPDIIERHRSDSTEHAFQIPRAMCTAGRGYSNFIDKINSVVKHESGIKIMAAGHYPPEFVGVWELVLDDKSDYIVRNAKFTSSSGSLNLEIETEGIKKNGKCVYPSKATFKMILKSLTLEYTYDFKYAAFEFDQALFEQSKAMFSRKLADTAIENDYTVSPPELGIVGSKKKNKSSSTLGTEKPVYWPYLLLINFLLLLFFVIYTYWSKRTGKS